jgi:hypothetical protein
MTRNLKRFVVFSILWTVPYFAAMHSLLLGSGVHSGPMTSVTILFVVLLSTVQRNLMDRDDRRAVRYDLDLRYAIVAVMASSVVFLVWVFAVPSHAVALLMGNAFAAAVLIAVNYFHGRSRIKGMSNEELFR